MLRYRTGVAGSAAGAASAAQYFLGETLKPENAELAKYYVGETVPENLPGLEVLGRAITEGDITFSAAADELVRAHGRMFGYPDDVTALEERISQILLKATDQVDRRETVAAEGGSVARIREDLDLRLAQRLGIDTTRPMTQSELARLLAGTRADNGQPVEGKQIHKPMKSVVEVFGLDGQALPTAAAIEHIMAGRRADGAAPRAATGNGEPLSDKVIDGARKRFLAAYDMPAGVEVTPEHIDRIKAGRTATDRFVDTGEVLRKLNAVRAPISYTDMIWSADKSVSTCFALAPTEAERTIIVQAHRDAVASAMAYAEDHLGFITKGRNGAGGSDKGPLASHSEIMHGHQQRRPNRTRHSGGRNTASVGRHSGCSLRHQTPPIIDLRLRGCAAIRTAGG